jgi:metal-sulfur cluster biosynthetic enzyme
MVSREEITEVIRNTYDPDLDIDLETLGLIYKVDFDEAAQSLRLTMTFTTPLCPYGGEIVEELTGKFKRLGVKEVAIDVVFNPPWTPPPGLRDMLGV